MRGWRVLVPSPGGEAIAESLRSAGAIPVTVPTIAVGRIETSALDDALRESTAYDWIVVTSANGVAALFERLRALGLDAPRAPRWAAVGPKTAAALESEGVSPDCVPEKAIGAAIPDGMGDLAGRRVLLARAEAAGEDLPAILRRRGAEVDDLDAYRTVEGPPESRDPLEAALESGLDAAIFTSGSTARGFVRLAGSADALADAVIVVIGPSTAAAAREAGFEPDAIAGEPTPDGLVAALEAAIRTRGGSIRGETERSIR